MTTSMNERTRFFKKIYLSHFILEEVDVGCAWVVSWSRGQTAILNPSFSNHSSTSFSPWLGLLNRVSLRAQSPLFATGSQFGIFSPTDSNCNWNWPKPSVAPGYIIVSHPPASAVPPLIYTGASLDWRLGRGSIYNTLKHRNCFQVLNVFMFKVIGNDIEWVVNY